MSSKLAVACIMIHAVSNYVVVSTHLKKNMSQIGPFLQVFEGKHENIFEISETTR